MVMRAQRQWVALIICRTATTHSCWTMRCKASMVDVQTCAEGGASSCHTRR